MKIEFSKTFQPTHFPASPFITRTLYLALLLILTADGNAATISTITANTVILSGLKTMNFSVAKSASVTTSSVTVVNWMALGNTILQTDNSDARFRDVACPVSLALTGSISTFSVVHDIIATPGDWESLAFDTSPTVAGHQVRIVNHLDWCSGTGVIRGCTQNFNNKTTLAQIVLDATRAVPGETLTHEVGHYQHLPDECDLTTTTCPDRVQFIMYGGGTGRNLIEAWQCKKYEQ